MRYIVSTYTSRLNMGMYNLLIRLKIIPIQANPGVMSTKSGYDDRIWERANSLAMIPSPKLLLLVQDGVPCKLGGQPDVGLRVPPAFGQLLLHGYPLSLRTQLFLSGRIRNNFWIALSGSHWTVTPPRIWTWDSSFQSPASKGGARVTSRPDTT
jgi:hypothetical protein